MNPYEPPMHDNEIKTARLYMIPLAILAMLYVIPLMIVMTIFAAIVNSPMIGEFNFRDCKDELISLWDDIVVR